MGESLNEFLENKEELSQGKSLSGFVFNHIREDILSGKYKVNEELREIAIGKELGVSRTPEIGRAHV